MEDTPQLDPAMRRAALDREMHDRLAPAAAVLAILYLAYALAHALLPGQDGAVPMAAATGATGVVFMLLDRRFRRGRVSPAQISSFAATIAALLLANCTFYLVLTDDPAHATELLFVFVGAGVTFLSWPVLAGSLVAGWLGFAAAAWLSQVPDEGWRYFAMTLATATGLSVFVHAARVRGTLRLAALQAAERARTGALRAALESLAASEQRYRELVENDLGIILTHDLDGRILSINPAAAGALRREREALVGVSLSRVVAPAFADLLPAYLERARGNGRDTGLLRVATPDGRERLWEYLCVLLREPERPPAILLHAHDITDRVELENRLRTARGELAGRVRARTMELEAANAALREEIDERRRIAERLLRYGQALEACTDAIVLAELDGRIVDANAAVVALCGASNKAEVIGRNLIELAAPEDRDRAARGSADVLGEQGGMPQEFALLQMNGERVPVEAALAVVRDESGQPCALVSVGRDITWRRQLENSLRHNEAYLRTLIEHSTDTIVVLDVDGTVLARPDSAESPIGRFGYLAEGLLGRFGQDFVHPDEVAAVASAFVGSINTPGATTSVECRVRDGAGQHRPAELVFCNLLDDPAVAGVMCSVRDLTERKNAECELRAARDAAEAASQAKSEFLNTMSHELRTPIHAVIGYAEMLDDGAFGDLNTEQREIVQRITDRARDQFELVAAVLDLSAMEAGRMTVQPRPVRLPDVCAEVEREGRKAWSESALHVEWDVPADLPVLLSDAGKIKIVVRNLVGNAVKFTPRGSVATRARASGGGVEIEVSDTGIGIPEGQRDAIFAPFFQLDGSETRRYEGSGLGLHIVKRLLDLLGGRIAVESEVGRGSTFRVWLPLQPVHEDAPCNGAERSAASVPDGAQPQFDAPRA